MDLKSKTIELRKIKDEVFDLKISPLYQYRLDNNYYPVLGEGNHHASIMFIGEAPGRNEAKTGRPFCGSAGKLLDELLKSINLKREDVYITNIIKDRPPENRDPLPEEIEIYGPFLDRQIDIIKPKFIVTLGRFSMSYIMNKFNLNEQSNLIGNIHGLLFEVNSNFKIIPLYHPAAAIYNQNLKQVLFDDFKKLKNYIK